MSDTFPRSETADIAWRAQALLESLTVVVSARVVQQADRPDQVHVLSTNDAPVSEVVRTVASALLSGLGLEVAASQISVAQSRLPADELARLVGRELAPPQGSPVVHEAEHAVANGQAQPPRRASDVTPRFELLDFHVARDKEGGLDVGVRLRGNGGSVERRRAGADTQHALEELPAAAALEAVQALMDLDGWSDGRQVTLTLLEARRLRAAKNHLVVALVEATVDGKTLQLAGSAAADGGIERASIIATLQATNPLVRGFQVNRPGSVGGQMA